MSDLTPCPTCQSMLRIPPKAAMIRCPKCKTVLAVEQNDGPPASAPPPPAPAKPSAPPLPFGRPPAKPAAAPPPPLPTPKASARAAGPAPVRARLAPVQTDDVVSSSSRQGETSEEATKREEMRRALAKLEEQEERDKERYAVITEQCKWGRLGLRLIGGGAMANVASGTLFSLYLISLVTIDGFGPLLALSAVCLVAHFLATAGGFGCCSAGAPGVRGAAAVGTICTLFQFLLAGAAAMTVLKSEQMAALAKRSTDPEAFLVSGMLLSSLFNNLITVAMLPFFIVGAKSIGIAVQFKVLAVPLVAGIVEFAKLSLVGIVANRYATEAKDEDLGHQAMRFVHRIFVAVLLGGILFPLSVPLAYLLADTLAFSKTGGGLVAVLMLPVGALQNGFYLWWVYAWFAQYQTLNDVAEAVVPGRVAYKGERLDSY